jgi:hypothetical protein
MCLRIESKGDGSSVTEDPIEDECLLIELTAEEGDRVFRASNEIEGPFHKINGP